MILRKCENIRRKLVVLFLIRSGASRQDLSNEHLVAKIVLDTAENGPLKVCQKLAWSSKQSGINLGSTTRRSSSARRSRIRWSRTRWQRSSRSPSAVSRLRRRAGSSRTLQTWQRATEGPWWMPRCSNRASGRALIWQRVASLQTIFIFLWGHEMSQRWSFRVRFVHVRTGVNCAPLKLTPE